MLRLLEQRQIQLTYLAEGLATITTNNTGVQVHDFVQFRVGGKQKAELSADEEIAAMMNDTYGRTRQTRQFVRSLVKFVATKTKINYFLHNRENMVDVARRDLIDDAFVDGAARDILSTLVPNFRVPSGWYFRALPADGGGFYANSNYDFARLNAEYHKTVPVEHSSLSPAFILSHLLDARMDLQLSCYYLAELLTTPSTTKIVGRIFSDLLFKRDRNQQQIVTFQEILLRDGRAIREAINSGKRNFSDFIQILEKASVFKGWLRGLSPDDNVLREYQKKATEGSWVASLPSKVLRFAAASVAGLVNPGLGLGLSAADSFLVDKLGRGWKPDQFVQGTLRSFIGDR